MMSDPIADMLIRIKNGYHARKKMVLVPYSRFKHDVAKIILKEGKIKKVTKIKRSDSPVSSDGDRVNPPAGGEHLAPPRWILEIELKYDGKQPALIDVKRVSRPSRRVYQKAKDLKSIQSGFGFSLVSTSAGLMTNKKAKRKNLGGEIICQIW